jgi:mycobactin lysine-N-oxygenase
MDVVRSPTTLIVIGAGPKALALTAKARVLTSLGFQVPEIVVIEKDEIGAYWGGRYGFTDGTPQLRRSIEKDVGYPYASTGSNQWSVEIGRQIDDHMRDYSWHRSQILHGHYAEWIDRGQPNPTHEEFHEYLLWVADVSRMDVRYGKVTSIGIEGGKWLISYETGRGELELLSGDGLVITGPGSPEPTPPSMEVVAGAGYFDAVTFWHEWPRLVKENLEGKQIGIIGAGDASAAIVVAILDGIGPTQRNSVPISIISRFGMVYSRGENYSENQMYSDPSDWDSLADEDRREFIRRTDRGVFAQQAQHRLNSAKNVKVLRGEVDINELSIQEKFIHAIVRYEGSTRGQLFDWVINSVSFNGLSFLDMLEDSVRSKLPTTEEGELTVESLEASIDPDLSVHGLEPALHLPMLAAFAQGPGFPNLSCLGLLSDRILGRYLKRLT